MTMAIGCANADNDGDASDILAPLIVFCELELGVPCNAEVISAIAIDSTSGTIIDAYATTKETTAAMASAIRF